MAINKNIGHTAGQILVVWLICEIYAEIARQNDLIQYKFYQMWR